MALNAQNHHGSQLGPLQFHFKGSSFVNYLAG